MSELHFNADDLLEFQTSKQVTNLYKSFLILVEDLETDHKLAFEKLKKALPEHKELIEQAEFLDFGKSHYIRKKVLDAGNDCRRQLVTELQNYTVNFSANSYNSQTREQGNAKEKDS
jgi:hypothetical protein